MPLDSYTKEIVRIAYEAGYFKGCCQATQTDGLSLLGNASVEAQAFADRYERRFNQGQPQPTHQPIVDALDNPCAPEML